MDDFVVVLLLFEDDRFFFGGATVEGVKLALSPCIED